MVIIMKFTTLCYIEKNDKYLMLYRNKKENDLNEGKWIGVGGKFEEKESPEECLIREVKEETGLTLTKYKLRCLVTFVSDKWETEHMYVFTASEFEGELKECNEGTLQWIDKDKILDLPTWEGDRFFFEKMQKRLDKISLICRENLSGNRVIRAFSKQKNEKKRIDDSTEDLAKTSIRVSILSALLSPVTYIITNAAIILIIWFGAQNVNAGSGMLSGDIIALVNYMTQILLAMIVVANLVVLLTKASASAARLNEVFETQPSVCESTTENIEISESESTPKIEFDNVNFTYGTGDDELEDISFKIKRGQTVGLIGGTGCGKSTLVNLIPRFYDATQGTVSVDGRNVKDYPFLQLRSQIGIVPQQSILFKGTIRDNMKWQNENATDEDIIKALKIAQAYEFVSKLNKGLDSFVEQGGKNFSGGQRQRLCIARALTGSPKLLILDDSFSALDFATDAALRKALRENTKDMTVIIVTQRCSTIKNADLILVLDDGRIVGKGPHDELFESCETYREICLSQLNEEEAKR